MPARDDIKTILVIGSGPIVIGQACEFDYSGTQAVKALKSLGYRVVLANSNPATIMTDPELADKTYLEPLSVEMMEQIIQKEKPEALLSTVGGQTALNLSMELHQAGILKRYKIDMIGANPAAIELAESREAFRELMLRVGLPVAPGKMVRTLLEGQVFSQGLGFPLIVRPSFTLGGTGGGIAWTESDLVEVLTRALRASPTHEALVEKSVLGWKEFELEVIRDRKNNFIVVCSIENLDPMGVHTGDSITVAPAQTLTDREYQRMRDMAATVIEAVGIETGGANVQFGVNPADGEIFVIEMNPRVSRSSALASKATGFPIAKVAAKLAVGLTLDEIPNDITKTTPASFEPSIDYVVVKLPRFNFEKFPGVDATLGLQMKSIGEAMSLGATFLEALGKGMSSLEHKIDSLVGAAAWIEDKILPLSELHHESTLTHYLRRPNEHRLIISYQLLKSDFSADALSRLTGYDPWFVGQLMRLATIETTLSRKSLSQLSADDFRRLKQVGINDGAIERITKTTRAEGEPVGMAARRAREALGVAAVFRMVDTCAGEFAAKTPYFYSCYETHNDAVDSAQEKVIILGAGPNRIGQGIEFDYCCCHAAMALKEDGIDSIMINSNPETVSTDYDTASRLYFEPITLEHLLNVVEREKPLGVIIQFGGQTSINLAEPLEKVGVRILGTSVASLQRAENRQQFGQLLSQLDIPQPEHDMAHSVVEALSAANRIGYPVLVRPSFVLGGRGMAIVYSDEQLTAAAGEAFGASMVHQTLRVDRYLENAYEVEVDAIGDGEEIVIGGIMQHIEQAGVHSGDSACVMPPYKVSEYHLNIIREYTKRIGRELKIKGLMNVQYAIQDDVIYVLETNCRGSRTVPFVSKVTGVPLAKIATRAIMGKSLKALGLDREPRVPHFFVKEAVFPFAKYLGFDTVLGPEMKSTGEVMGHAETFGHAFLKAQLAAGNGLPKQGTVFLSVNHFDKGASLMLGKELQRLGFKIVATDGTADYLQKGGVNVRPINKVSQGSPHVVDAIARGELDLIINTPLGSTAHSDGQEIRTAAIRYGVPYMTTMSAASAAITGMAALHRADLDVIPIQALYL